MMIITILVALIACSYLYIISITNTEKSTDLQGVSWSSAKVTTLRLEPGEDIKLSLLDFVKSHKLSACSIVTTVGSTDQVRIRLASASSNNLNQLYIKEDNFEIVSLVGTMEYNKTTGLSYGHMHISIADAEGKVFGGHLMEGCRVRTTAEITLMHLPSLQYNRIYDSRSGFNELSISAYQMNLIQRIIHMYLNGYSILMQEFFKLIV